VVGDQCIDDTPEKIKNIDDKRVVFIDLPKRGKYPKHIKDRWFVQGSVPRNKGMKIANGKWFVFISDDDIIYENHIETLLKAAKKENLEFISASFKSVKDGEDLLTYPEKQWMLTPFPKFKGHIYNSDNLATVNRRNFINEPKFIQAEKMALQLRHLSIGHLAAR
jgi:hypothetical protein